MTTPMLTGNYNTGLVSVTEDDTTVLLTGGLTTSLVAGDFFQAGKCLGIVDSVTDSTHFELSLPWAGDTLVSAEYQVYFFSPQRYSQVYNGQKVRELLTLLDGIGIMYYVSSDASAPDPGLGDDGNFAVKIVPGTSWKFWVKQSGAWVSLGSPVGLAWQGVWSASHTGGYFPNDVVSRLGTTYIAKAANTNNPPESNPVYWDVLITASNLFPLLWSDSDQPASGEVILKTKFGTQVTFPAGMAASKAFADAAPTADAVFSLKKNGVEFATYKFLAGQTTATFTCPSDTVFSASDVYSEVAPAPRDATLKGVSSTKIGYR